MSRDITQSLSSYDKWFENMTYFLWRHWNIWVTDSFVYDPYVKFLKVLHVVCFSVHNMSEKVEEGLKNLEINHKEKAWPFII